MIAPPSVLFVCLGNICRSPLAEGALRAEADRLRLSVAIDSAGTGSWHVGEPPDPRAIAVARRHGIDIAGYRARQVSPDDFARFTWIVALDRNILSALRRIRPDHTIATLTLLLDHVPGREGQNVADPYYGDEAGFARTWEDVAAGARGIARSLLTHGA